MRPVTAPQMFCSMPSRLLVLVRRLLLGLVCVVDKVTVMWAQVTAPPVFAFQDARQERRRSRQAGSVRSE